MQVERNTGQLITPHICQCVKCASTIVLLMTPPIGDAAEQKYRLKQCSEGYFL